MKSPTQLPEYQMVGWVSWFQMTDRRCSVLTKASVIIPAAAAMATPQAQEARMIGRGQEARMQEAISWSWKQFCPSPRAARRPHPFLIRVIIICRLHTSKILHLFQHHLQIEEKLIRKKESSYSKCKKLQSAKVNKQRERLERWSQ